MYNASLSYYEKVDLCALCAVLESVTPGTALLHISKEFSECQLGGERERWRLSL